LTRLPVTGSILNPAASKAADYASASFKGYALFISWILEASVSLIKSAETIKSLTRLIFI
jgi:hypothetical protein